ncbi:hypothetical protein Btru_064804 [Bulinus truncatus]|nr:hypothetical protein Btru_064804 [Bulinus truncatus]
MVSHRISNPIITVTPDHISKPIITVTPDHVSNPIITVTPDHVSKPIITVTPDHVSNPIITVTPDHVSKPIITATPDHVSNPIITVTPDHVSNPIITVTPDHVSKPIITVTPDHVSKPIITATPDHVSNPIITVTPDHVSNPIITVTPDHVSKPIITATPDHVSNPIITATPDHVSNPIITATPDHVSNPIITVTPDHVSNPIITVTPDHVSNPIITVTPDHVSNPIITVTPDHVSNPIITVTPDHVSNPIITVTPDHVSNPIITVRLLLPTKIINEKNCEPTNLCCQLKAMRGDAENIVIASVVADGRQDNEENDEREESTANGVGQKGADDPNDRTDVNLQEVNKEKPIVTNEENDAKLNASNDETREEKVDLSCGIWKFRTHLLGSCYSNLYLFATLVGISSLFSEMIRSIIHVQLTSIEKQFNIDNSRAGLFDVVARAGYLSTILFAGHFAKKANIPVIIGLSGVFQGFLLTTPAFLQLADPYKLPILTSAVHSNVSNTTNFGDNAKYICDFAGGNETKHKTENLEPTYQVAFIVILAVQTIKGITDTFHASFLPILYMDDNILDKGKMGIFLGIQQVISDLASPIGKQINGIMTEIPIDLKKTELDPKDGRFVAAWWLAFLVFGTGLGIVSFPLILFPRKLISRSKQKEALDKAVVTYAGGNIEEEIVEPESTESNSDCSERKPSINRTETQAKTVRKYSVGALSSRKSSVGSVAHSSSRRLSHYFLVHSS